MEVTTHILAWLRGASDFCKKNHSGLLPDCLALSFWACLEKKKSVGGVYWGSLKINKNNTQNFDDEKLSWQN